MKKTVDDRFEPYGYKVHYPDNIYYSSDWTEYFSENNKLDELLSDDEKAKKWLYINVEKFTIFCEENHFTPIGIIPWKLFSMSLIPIFKDPDFLNMCAPKIDKFTQEIERIKILANDIPRSSARVKFLKDEIKRKFATKVSWKSS